MAAYNKYSAAMMESVRMANDAKNSLHGVGTFAAGSVSIRFDRKGREIWKHNGERVARRNALFIIASIMDLAA